MGVRKEHLRVALSQRLASSRPQKSENQPHHRSESRSKDSLPLRLESSAAAQRRSHEPAATRHCGFTVGARGWAIRDSNREARLRNDHRRQSEFHGCFHLAAT